LFAPPNKRLLNVPHELGKKIGLIFLGKNLHGMMVLCSRKLREEGAKVSESPCFKVVRMSSHAVISNTLSKDLFLVDAKNE
jgi:hypothetical protein